MQGTAKIRNHSPGLGVCARTLWNEEREKPRAFVNSLSAMLYLEGYLPLKGEVVPFTQPPAQIKEAPRRYVIKPQVVTTCFALRQNKTCAPTFRRICQLGPSSLDATDPQPKGAKISATKRRIGLRFPTYASRTSISAPGVSSVPSSAILSRQQSQYKTNGVFFPVGARSVDAS